MDIFFIYTFLEWLNTQLKSGVDKSNKQETPVSSSKSNTSMLDKIKELFKTIPSGFSSLTDIFKNYSIYIFPLIIARLLYLAITKQSEQKRTIIEHIIVFITGFALIYADKSNGQDIAGEWYYILKNAILYVAFPITIAYLVFEDANPKKFFDDIMQIISPFENVAYILLGGLGLYAIYKGIKSVATSGWIMDTISAIVSLLFIAGWIYLFMQLFTFSLTNISLLIIPIIYLTISAVYLFVNQYNANSTSGSMYATVTTLFFAILYSLKDNVSIALKTLYTVIASLISSWTLTSSGSPLAYIPFLLLISITLMVVSSMIILISYTAYKNKYMEKEGESPEELSGNYKDYYDGYVSRMIWFIATSIMTTIGYKFYVNSTTDIEQVRYKQNPSASGIFTMSNAAWLSTNVTAIIMNIFASQEIFNSSRFLHISRSLTI